MQRYAKILIYKKYSLFLMFFGAVVWYFTNNNYICSPETGV